MPTPNSLSLGRVNRASAALLVAEAALREGKPGAEREYERAREAYLEACQEG